MNEFIFFAEPWWVNILMIVPFLAYFSWRKDRLGITVGMLAFTGLFAVAFGFMEATLVVYLRAAVGLLPGYGGTL